MKILVGILTGGRARESFALPSVSPAAVGTLIPPDGSILFREWSCGDASLD
jgi:hypothetical protein